MKTMTELRNILGNFNLEGEFFFYEPFGCGHINNTYAVYFKQETIPPRRYILQRINKFAFTEPEQLMENIVNVTSFLKEKIIASGGDIERETLNIMFTKDDKSFFIDNDDDYWRVYLFVENATSHQSATKPELFETSARAFGKFQKLLKDFPASTLFETIKEFHNTAARYERLEEAIAEDAVGRKSEVEPEIEFARERKELASSIINLLESEEIPYRVTHNDTKLNNVMLDNTTEKELCVIDLDTVMPGSAVYDFGDSIRFGASTAPEDEKDLSKVTIDLNLFEMFTKGFLSEAKDILKDKEIDNLALGSIVITFECGMRFLTDYLSGDKYFRIHYPEQNLDRCRTQFKLVKDMEDNLDKMNEIVNKYR